MAVAPPNFLFDEITDFLLKGPTPEEIIAFRPLIRSTSGFMNCSTKTVRMV